MNSYSSQMPVSLSCALESISETYCQADDSFALINLESQTTALRNCLLHFGRGWTSMGRRFSGTTSRWLEHVKNGIPPADPNKPQNKSMLKGKVLAVESTNLDVIGAINQTIEFYKRCCRPNHQNVTFKT